MKKICGWVLALSLTLDFCACGQKKLATTWQEQYDLGIRYLSEGNYEAAIIAFNAAIEIDPKQEDAYKKAAEAYIAMNNTEAAADILQQGIEETDSELLRDLLQNLSAGSEPEQEPEIEPEPEPEPNLDPLANEIGPDGKNSYGSTPFVLRENYIAYDDLSDKVRDFIGEAILVLEQNQRDALLELATFGTDVLSEEKETSRFFGFYTYYAGYRIFVKNDVWDREEYEDTGWIIEARPESGMGFYAKIGNNRILDINKVEVNSYGHYSYYEWEKSIITASCMCEDWQWNGECEIFDTYHYLQRSGTVNGSENISEHSIWTQITGTMVNGLRHGEFREETQSTFSESSFGYTDNFEYNGLVLYENGKLVSVLEDGERYAYTEGYYMTIGGETRVSMDASIDEFFW